jgi:tetratricopeptide (TPR) repeat protein
LGHHFKATASMSTPYYHFGKRSYIDFLQDKSFVDGVRGEVRSSTRSLISASERLQRDQISATQKASVDVSNQLRSLSSELGRGLTELNSTFHWGFSEILMSLGGVAVSLDELFRIAKIPSKTWAYEQFDDAREAYRKQLFPEALEYVERAINGYADHTGYNLEYRFHYFLGVLRVGSFRNSTNRIVDLVQAHAAFLNAARYSIHDEPQEAAKAYLGAGWASYCQGQMDLARAYTEQAALLDPSLSRAFFQLAKVSLCLGDIGTGVKHLRTAILRDPGYVREANDDKDFHHEAVEQLLTALSQEAKRPYEQAATVCEERLQILQQLASENPSIGNFPEIESILTLLNDARALSASGTYEDYLEAMTRTDLARSRIDKESARIRGELEALARRKRQTEDDAQRNELANRVAHAERSATFAKSAMWLSIGGLFCFGFPSVGGLILGLISHSRVQQFDSPEVRKQVKVGTAKAQSLVAIIVGGIITLALGLAVLEALLKG